MYKEKFEPILEDLENKEIEIAGGSVVGMALSSINSLIIYITNLTIGKKKYKEVENKVKEIQKKAYELKDKSLEVIDKDREILEEILNVYKIRKENEEKYQEVCKKATEFCLDVVELANQTIDLSNEISKVGNKMLASDFKICKYYAEASRKSAIENVLINVKSIDDEKYRNKIMQNISY